VVIFAHPFFIILLYLYYCWRSNVQDGVIFFTRPFNDKGRYSITFKFIQSKTKTKENIPCIIDEKGERNTNDN
jgi:hypothetical protein